MNILYYDYAPNERLAGKEKGKRVHLEG